MEFDTVAIAAALGAILAHGVRAGEKRFKKGRVLSQADLVEIAAIGIATVTVARLENGDIGEDLAATRVAALCSGKGVRTGVAFTGRVNLYATSDGLSLIDGAVIDALNAIDEAVTIATVAPYTRVTKGQLLATEGRG
jgi:molybdenum cofactor cytidylyltransferase